MQQLGQIMTAQEFGQHYLLEQVEPQQPPARWIDPDAPIGGSSEATAPQTVDQIMAAAKAHGMVP